MSTSAAPLKPSPNPSVLKGLIFIMKTLKDPNGRGNFNKSLQYLTKYLSIVLAEGAPKDPWAQAYGKASVFINNGRKLGFLGLWMESFDTAAKADWSNPRKAVAGLSNLLTGIYYIFDNIIFLQKASLSNFMSENNQANRIAMAFFWASQFVGLMGEIMDLRTTYQEETTARRENKKESLPAVYKKRQDLFLNVVVRLGNLTYSANGFDLSTTLLGAPFSEKTCAIAGLIAGVVALYKNAVAANQ